MQKYALLAIFGLTVSSCNYRIFVNGKFDHAEKGLTSHWRVAEDSCYIYEENETVPDSAILVNETKLLSPYVWLTGHSGQYMLVNKAMKQTWQSGGNAFKIVSEDATKMSRLHLLIKVYSLRGQTL